MLSSFHFNGNTIGFYPQTQKLEPPFTVTEDKPPVLDSYCVFMLLYITYFNIVQAAVVQKLDSAIHRINHYPADKY